MKAAFALLANTEVHNVVRKLAWQIHLKYGTGTQHCRLPPHISLKQAFRIADLTALEEYMDEFVRSFDPFEVSLPQIQVVPTVHEGVEYGILWLDVQETTTLRQLHDRLNDELSQRFGNTQADYDGPDYHFHMTVMLGGQPMAAYRKFYSEIAYPSVNLCYTVRELGMFVFDEPIGPNGEYLSYRILPIGGAGT